VLNRVWCGTQAPDGDAEIPLGQLVNLKANGSTNPVTMRARAQALARSKQSFKRDSKHRPAEASSKRPVPVLRDVFQTGKRESRDPRFESLSGGQFSDDRFKKQYAFLYDEQLPEERRALKEALHKVKSESKKEDLKARLLVVQQQLRAEEQRRKKDAAAKQIKAKERDAVRAGKNPFYLKKSEKRKVELVDKYEELKRSGKLEAYMAKRRKKNASKDHRYLPVGRRAE
jgi:ribosomal RNA-processing protein 36